MTVATRVAQPEVLVAAPPFRPSLLHPGNLAVVVIGVLLAVLIGFVELEYMLAVFGGVLLLVAMLIRRSSACTPSWSPSASPDLRPGGRGFSISAFEPLTALVFLFWLLQGVTRGSRSGCRARACSVR